MHKLLVVDDSMIIRNKISRLPEDKGYQVVANAHNGRDALEKYAEHQPDIVTLDLTMPEMDGLETIPKLVEMNPNVLILVVSALSDRATGLEALELGASGFVTKPFTSEELLKALDRMVKYAEKRSKS